MNLISFTDSAVQQGHNDSSALSPVFGVPASGGTQDSQSSQSEGEKSPPRKKSKKGTKSGTERKKVDHAPNWKPEEMQLLLDNMLPNIVLLSRELSGEDITNQK